jgi:hypothetical protein
VLQHRGYVTDDLAADPDINKTLTTTAYPAPRVGRFIPSQSDARAGDRPAAARSDRAIHVQGAPSRRRPPRRTRARLRRTGCTSTSSAGRTSRPRRRRKRSRTPSSRSCSTRANRSSRTRRARPPTLRVGQQQAITAAGGAQPLGGLHPPRHGDPRGGPDGGRLWLTRKVTAKRSSRWSGSGSTRTATG